MSPKVEELKGASMKTAQWMLDFLYSKPDEECGWTGASAEELSQLASLADKLQIVQLQRKVNIYTKIVSSYLRFNHHHRLYSAAGFVKINIFA